MSVYSVNCFRLSAIAFYDKIVSVTDDDRMQDFKREKQEAGTVQVKLCSFFEAVQVFWLTSDMYSLCCIDIYILINLWYVLSVLYRYIYSD